jgi:uncharacterized damage-inducible protein DinB
MPDPILDSARKLVTDSLEELGDSIDNLSAEALNWRPMDDANSIAAIATHALLATRLWLRMAVGLPLPERKRDAEFLAAPTEADEFRRFAQTASSECIEALDSAEGVDWTAMRQTLGRGGDAPPEVPAAYALIHATEHLRGHVDQVSLMRTLWLSRA